MHEIETKILEVNEEEISKKLRELGAIETEKSRLFVDWYSQREVGKDGVHPWYFRVRKNSSGVIEMTWKSLETFVGNTRQSKEINLNISDFENGKKIIEEIGLIHYAHQEKDRHSFHFKDWNFDIDTYPNMPTYLEIEGISEKHVGEAIKLLELENYIALSQGETKLIKERYNLDWYNMTFDK